MNVGRILLVVLTLAVSVRAEDGYRLWLRYERIGDDALRGAYRQQAHTILLATPTGASSPTLAAAREELTLGLTALLGAAPKLELLKAAAPAGLGEEGFSLRATRRGLEIAAARDVGVLYGAFALLRTCRGRSRSRA